METGTALEKTSSEKFTNMVVREFSATVGDGLELTPHQKKLAQHMFIKIDMQLKELETKRLSKANPTGSPITWANINLDKLALDVVHRVDLGLDALIPNHVHPIPYFNSRLKKYDLDLRIGYVGKDYYRRKVAKDEPLNIIYELVYATDKFKPIKKSLTNQTETYEFEITNAFNRGEIIGGFGYIMYEDPRKNLLVIVTPKDYKRSKDAAKTSDFWNNDPEAMHYKTIVHRTTNKLGIDPEKASASFVAVEAQDNEEQIEAEVIENANQSGVIDIPADEVVEEQLGEEIKPEQLAQPGF